MKDFQTGIRLQTNRWMFILALTWEYFSWTPGHIESGQSYPSEHLPSINGDRYFLYGWLCFTIFWADDKYHRGF